MCKLFSPPPPKQTKWYWTVLCFVTTLWCLGGINILLLQDIPLLLFLGISLVLIHLPIARYIGRPQRRWIDLVWRFVVIAAMIALALFVIPPFSISPQTTYLTEPRSKEHFGIDYQTVIEKQLDPKVPAEENGFRLLTESLGRPFFGEQFKDRHWSRLCQYLDLPTEIDPKLSFIDWRTYTKTLKPEENELALFRQPFSDDEIKAILLNDRLTVLDSLQQFHALAEDAQGPAADFLDRFARKTTMRFCRMGNAMVGANRRFDDWERRFLNDLPEPKEERETFSFQKILAIFAWHGQINSFQFFIGQILSRLHFETMAVWRPSFKTRRADASLTRIVFALESYRRDHDRTYPKTLDDLLIRYLDEIPSDPFSQEPFRYVIRLSEDGKPEFLLYSVGPNGTDEEGRNQSDAPRGDDLRRCPR